MSNEERYSSYHPLLMHIAVHCLALFDSIIELSIALHLLKVPLITWNDGDEPPT